MIFVLSVGKKIKSTDFADFTDVAKEKSVIFVLSVGQKIKSTDFTDFTDVVKQESVIFVLSVGRKKNQCNQCNPLTTQKQKIS